MAKARASSHYLKYGNLKKKVGQADDENKESKEEDGVLSDVEVACPEGDEACEQAKADASAIQDNLVETSDYFRKLFLGVINGFVSSFNANCAVGLTSTVNSFFDVVDNLAIYNPTKIAKFQISSVNFTEATNQVYAFCDVTQLTKQFTYLSDYENYENYIIFASRIGGTLVNYWGEMATCIEDG